MPLAARLPGATSDSAPLWIARGVRSNPGVYHGAYEPAQERRRDGYRPRGATGRCYRWPRGLAKEQSRLPHSTRAPDGSLYVCRRSRRRHSRLRCNGAFFSSRSAPAGQGFAQSSDVDVTVLIDCLCCLAPYAVEQLRENTRPGFSSRYSSSRNSVGPRWMSRARPNAPRLSIQVEVLRQEEALAMRSGRRGRSSARTRAINSGTEKGFTT